MIDASTQAMDYDVVYDKVPTVGNNNSQAYLYKDVFNRHSYKSLYSKKSSLINQSQPC